jgi:predicted TIM-barrel fold metal-dependent hydrolase
MVGAVISADPTRAEFEAEISTLAKDSCLKGIRYSLRSPEEIHAPGVLKNIQLLGELGLSMDMNFDTGSLHLANLLLEECPKTRFIINHCGGADPIAFLPEERKVPGEARHHKDQWYAEMKKLAIWEHVICKISGIVDNAGAYPLEAADLAPIVNFCLDTFGPDRVFFGGDWPVCLRNMPLATWISTLKEVVAKRSVSDQRKLFHDNAAAFYRV